MNENTPLLSASRTMPSRQRKPAVLMQSRNYEYDALDNSKLIIIRNHGVREIYKARGDGYDYRLDGLGDECIEDIYAKIITAFILLVGIFSTMFVAFIVLTIFWMWSRTA
jgi:hypothetical protein